MQNCLLVFPSSSSKFDHTVYINSIVVLLAGNK